MYTFGTSRLGIGLRELAGGVIIVHTLKRVQSVPGAAESAGLRLGDKQTCTRIRTRTGVHNKACDDETTFHQSGDILLGVNYHAFSGGLERVVDLLKDAQAQDVIHLQVSRDLVSIQFETNAKNSMFCTNVETQMSNNIQNSLYFSRALHEAQEIFYFTPTTGHNS